VTAETSWPEVEAYVFEVRERELERCLVELANVELMLREDDKLCAVLRQTSALLRSRKGDFTSKARELRAQVADA
jgi:hypothetical protein